MFYERFCPALLPPMEVYFRLQVVKDVPSECRTQGNPDNAA
jgi:hypothetical protein